MHPSHLILVVACLLGTSAAAQQSHGAALTRPDGAGPIPATAGPVDAQITVLLKLADDPVAVVRGRAPGKQLDAATAEAVAWDLQQKQEALVPLIEARGGTVRAKLQHAVNGITVTLPASLLSAIATIPGVVGVKQVATHELDNYESVPFIGADAVWGGTPGFRGEGIKIFVLDTGVDYTHANFGGPGTRAAFAAAAATSTAPADPALFGPGAPKVKGGTDLVGDAYDANVTGSVPMPDPNPLDCGGHGSHTAGTATGFGVGADGHTFHGPYDSTTAGLPFAIGPGVAPLADLYSVRVFGCSGSTNVVTEAIDWSVAHGADVISMSLGSNFGSEGSSDAEASENAQEAGVIVVAASGNAGNFPYITSSPAAGDKTVSVAAMDSRAGFPGASVALSTGVTLTAVDANGAHFSDGTTLGVVVLKSAPGVISLGCNPAEYTAANVAGKLAVTRRGTCARVARAIFGQQAGAAAVLMVNNQAGLPPYEGPITSNPDTGIPYTVTIPFFGVLSSAGAALLAADGGTATLTGTLIANPSYRSLAGFSSSGPLSLDAHLKPDLSAPGVSIFSTAVGTGNGGLFESGTSMATPHVAGVAALALQAHPGWNPDDVRKAMINASSPSQLAGYIPRLAGAGLVQAIGATRNTVVATAGNDEPSVSFGVAEFTRDFHGTRQIRLRNFGHRDARFSVTAAPVNGSPHTASVSRSSVTVEEGRDATIEISLDVPAATSGDSSGFREVAGVVTFTPTSASGNNGVTLSVPYYLVPRARALVTTRVSDDFGVAHPAAVAHVRNSSKTLSGTADFYALGVRGHDRAAGDVGIRAVGAQSFDGGPGLGQVVVFAVSTFHRWSNPSSTFFDIYLDVNGDGVPDFVVEAADVSFYLPQFSLGSGVVTVVFDLHHGGGVIEFNATAGTDQSTMLLPVVAADLGLTPANPRFAYVEVQASDFFGATDTVVASGGFNAFNNALSTGGFASLAPGGTAAIPLTIDPAEWAKTPALGLMVVGLENRNSGDDDEDARQAQLIRLGEGGDD